MQTSTDSEGVVALEEFLSAGADTCNETPSAILWRGAAGNDATWQDATTLADDAEPWVRRVLVANRSADCGTGDAPVPGRPTSSGLYLAARAHRSHLLGESAVTVLRAAGGLARRAYARYRQRREARNIRDVLRGLDDRMLRDLGLDRSEIASVAAEVTGEAEHTRVRAQLSSHGLP